MSDVTLMLQAPGRGEERTREEMRPLASEELRHLAATRRSQEPAGHKINTHLPASWLKAPAAPPAPQIVGGQWQAIAPISGQTQFFRPQ